MADQRAREVSVTKIGLYTVSFSGAWYEGPGLPLDEIFKRATEMGFDGVEIGAKRPQGCPTDSPVGTKGPRFPGGFWGFEKWCWSAC